MKKVLILMIILGIILIPVIWYLVFPLFTETIVNESSPVEEKEMNEFMDERFGFELMGNFIDADSFHKTSGVAKIIETDSKKYLRLEDFETTNGPSLKVYLSTDIKATEYFSLGDLKGTKGDQNYEIPASVNLEDYDYVLIWCEPFSVLFGSARLE